MNIAEVHIGKANRASISQVTRWGYLLCHAASDIRNGHYWHIIRASNRHADRLSYGRPIVISYRNVISDSDRFAFSQETKLTILRIKVPSYSASACSCTIKTLCRIQLTSSI